MHTITAPHLAFTLAKVEDKVEFSQQFDDLETLFKFLGESLDPVLGLLGGKIGELNVQLANNL